MSNAFNCIGIGGSNVSDTNGGVAIGINAIVTGNRSLAMGAYSSATARNAVALSSGSANQKGQFDISVSQDAGEGYNSSNYRLLTGLYDPQNAHDAATKGYVDTLIGNIETALHAINNGSGD